MAQKPNYRRNRDKIMNGIINLDTIACEEQDEKHLRDKLADTRLLRARALSNGVDSHRLTSECKRSRDNTKFEDIKHKQENHFANNFTKKESAYNRGLSMRSSSNEENEDIHMLRFVEHELKKKKGEINNSPKRYEIQRKYNDQNDHFLVPEHLKGTIRGESNPEAQTWLLGIQESKLTQTFRLKNIEETELAKKRLLERDISNTAIININSFEKKPNSFLHNQLISKTNVVMSKKQISLKDNGANDEKMAQNFMKYVFARKRN